jgi:hypothetical protein
MCTPSTCKLSIRSITTEQHDCSVCLPVCTTLPALMRIAETKRVTSDQSIFSYRRFSASRKFSFSIQVFARDISKVDSTVHHRLFDNTRARIPVCGSSSGAKAQRKRHISTIPAELRSSILSSRWGIAIPFGEVLVQTPHA